MYFYEPHNLSESKTVWMLKIMKMICFLFVRIFCASSQFYVMTSIFGLRSHNDFGKNRSNKWLHNFLSDFIYIYFCLQTSTLCQYQYMYLVYRKYLRIPSLRINSLTLSKSNFSFHCDLCESQSWSKQWAFVMIIDGEFCVKSFKCCVKQAYEKHSSSSSSQSLSLW